MEINLKSGTTIPVLPYKLIPFSLTGYVKPAFTDGKDQDQAMRMRKSYLRSVLFSLSTWLDLNTSVLRRFFFKFYFVFFFKRIKFLKTPSNQVAVM